MSLQKIFASCQAPFRVMGKSIWRDLLNTYRYKAGLFGWLLNLLLSLGAAFLFGFLFNFNSITTTEVGLSKDQVLVFYAGGVALSTFSYSAIWSPLVRVEQDLHYGTFEFIFVTPMNRLAYLISPTISNVIIDMLFFIPAFLLIMGINGSITNPYVLGMTFVVVLLTIFSLTAFGVFFAMTAMLVRKSRAIAYFLNSFFKYFCGAFVPVQAFVGIHPKIGLVLKDIALAFPYTYCYDLFRFFTFGSAYRPLVPIWAEFVILISSSMLFLVIAGSLLKFIEKKAKERGLALL